MIDFKSLQKVSTNIARRALALTVKLNQKLIRRIETKEKTQVIRDAGQPGLRLDVHPSGLKCWKVEVRRKGRLIKRTLGRWPQMPIQQAREQAALLLGRIDELTGVAPVTFGELYRKWSAENRKRTAAEDDRKFKKHLIQWDRRSASSIKQEDVRSLHERLGRDSGKILANRALSLIKAIFEYGCSISALQENPARHVSKYPERSRQRFLTSAELPRFLDACDLEVTDYCDLFQLLLYTGARKGNVCSMRWQDLDLHGGTWIISPENSKNGRQLFLPLARAALEILLRRQSIHASNSPWVFPAPRNATGHLTELRRPWLRVCRHAKLDDFRIHDLRHSNASWQAMGGSSLPVIGKSLGHSDSKTTQRYAHLQIDPVRRSVDTAVDAMRGTRKGNANNESK